jgi:hypothetical protein
VVKLDSLGNIQWDKTVGGDFADEFSDLKQTTDGGYILGGNSVSDSSGEKTENSRGLINWWIDYWVVKLDSLGNVQWDKTIGGNDQDILTSLQQTTDGGYILGGFSYSDSSGEKTESKHRLSDYWVVKLDSLHNIQWDKTIGGNDADQLSTVKERKENRYVLGGTSYSDAAGNKNDTSRGSADFWIVALVDETDSTGADSISSYKYSFAVPNGRSTKEFKVYPNPAKDVLHVQTNGKAILSLTDQSGKVLLTQTIEGNRVINIAPLPAGLYYLKNNSTGVTQKVIITR